MVFHKCRHGTDLHRVGIICRILKESIVRVEELLRQKEEEFSRRTTVIQAAEEAEARESIMNRKQGTYLSLGASVLFQSQYWGMSGAALALLSGSQWNY